MPNNKRKEKQDISMIISKIKTNIVTLIAYLPPEKLEKIQNTILVILAFKFISLLDI